MPWIGGAIAGGLSLAGGIGGALIGSNASSQASKDQIAAQTNALNWVKTNYANTSANLQPYIGAGQSALGSLLGFYGLPGGNSSGATQSFQQFQNTPFYQFPLQQANLATNRALASSGLIGSGAQLRDVSQLNAGYASQGLGQFLSGLTGIAGSGQNAASSLGSIGVNTGAQLGQAYTNIGNAGAIGAIGSANAINQGINNTLPLLTGSGGSSYGNGSGGLIGQLINGFNSSGSSISGDQSISNPNVSGGSYFSNSNPNANF